MSDLSVCLFSEDVHPQTLKFGVFEKLALLTHRGVGFGFYAKYMCVCCT